MKRVSFALAWALVFLFVSTLRAQNGALSVSTAPQPAGAQTVQVLTKLGYSSSEIERLRAEGAV